MLAPNVKHTSLRYGTLKCLPPPLLQFVILCCCLGAQCSQLCACHLHHPPEPIGKLPCTPPAAHTVHISSCFTFARVTFSSFLVRVAHCSAKHSDEHSHSALCSRRVVAVRQAYDNQLTGHTVAFSSTLSSRIDLSPSDASAGSSADGQVAAHEAHPRSISAN